MYLRSKPLDLECYKLDCVWAAPCRRRYWWWSDKYRKNSLAVTQYRDAGNRIFLFSSMTWTKIIKSVAMLWKIDASLYKEHIQIIGKQMRNKHLIIIRGVSVWNLNEENKRWIDWHSFTQQTFASLELNCHWKELNRVDLRYPSPLGAYITCTQSGVLCHRPRVHCGDDLQ